MLLRSVEFDRMARSLAPHASPLARFLLGAYILLVVYASLYPLSGWRDQGANPFAYLGAPLPRYYTAFDIFANVIGYIPAGFLIVASLRSRFGVGKTVAIATVASALLSISMEAVQTYLPSRHPSNLDVASNLLGAFAGAVADAVIVPRLLGSDGLLGARDRWFRSGAATDFGLVLIATWLLTQLNPETLLFGNGSLRDVVGALSGQLYGPSTFVQIEAAVAAAQVAAVGLLAGALVAPERRWWPTAVGVIVAALIIRSIAYAALFTPTDMFGWFTRGAMLGLGAGTVLLLASGFASRPVRLAVAGLLLMFATALVNVAPVNPYSVHALSVWRKGHFLSLSGMTGFVSTVWPFMALSYLLFAGNRRT